MTFKVGVTRDLLTAAGTPAVGERAFDVLGSNPAITWEWLAHDMAELTPDVMAAYDGLYVNLPRVSAASVGRADCRVKIIARNGVGYDAVDLDACSARGIIVTNTPLAVRRPVAVATLTLVFALAGRLFKKNEIVRQGRWNDRTTYMGQGLTSRTFGVVGAGGVGQEILRVARPFFGRMLAADPYANAAAIKDLGADIVPLPVLMSEADFVVVACLLNDETRHLIDAAALARMKTTAYFVNVGRGPIVDEKALIRSLQEGRIAGAGLDVTYQEPIEPDNALLAMDNVIITPHALCWTDECFHDIGTAALRSIVDVSLGKRPVHVVNRAALEKAGLKAS
jgi:phosphoglycerate dehydrogenase-like enzyme